MSGGLIRGIVLVGVLGIAGFGLYYAEKRHEPGHVAVAAETTGGTAAPEKRQPPEAASGAAVTPSSAAKSSAKEAVQPADTGIALRPGETLEFRANVSQLNNVANLRVQVVERRNFLGKSVWHLQAAAHTENPLRFVFALDDQFDSYSDATSLNSLQYELHLNERGQKVDSVQRLTASGSTPAAPGTVEAHVLPGTRDPLGMMQYLRTVDWSRTPEVQCPVYDGHKLYDVRAKLDGTQSVTVPAGTYEASKIAIRVLDNGVEMKDASFALYLAKNQARTPVLLEAVLPFASARVELNKIQ
ncbi:MAG TPA: DUF3108 domain-containing protein [Candidatus Acidoferrales bacterium]|nr:DUF3108 domain-containing protein [Candidatus Acidoferrales bacterium]